MAKIEFNFNKIKRKFINVVLKPGTAKDKNGKEVEHLTVKMPRHKTFERMNAISNIDEESEDLLEAYDTLADLCAEIISNNMEKIEIEAEDLENYDFEELNELLGAYLDFVNMEKDNPN